MVTPGPSRSKSLRLSGTEPQTRPGRDSDSDIIVTSSVNRLDASRTRLSDSMIAPVPLQVVPGRKLPFRVCQPPRPAGPRQLGQQLGRRRGAAATVTVSDE